MKPDGTFILAHFQSGRISLPKGKACHISIRTLAAYAGVGAYQNNVDPVTISRRLGHSRVSTTQDIYCHLIEQADDTARDAIGNVLFGNEKKPQPSTGKQNVR